MARTIINLPLRNSVDESYNTAVNILQANGFKEVSYNGETVWKKGTGLLTAMQYIKIEFTDGATYIFEMYMQDNQLVIFFGGGL